MRDDTTFIITLNCGTRAVPRDQIEAVLYGARDWLRLAPNVYLVRTKLNADDWYHRIRAVLNPTDNIFVSAIDRQKMSGWLTNMAIDWLHREVPTMPNGQ